MDDARQQIVLRVLGSGTCIPSATRASAGYWVEAGNAIVRLDCGAGSVHAMARQDLPWESLTHQFISHFHIDHAGELAALLFAFKYGRSEPRTAPLTLIGPKGLRHLAAGFERLFGTRILQQEFPIDIAEIGPADEVSLDAGVTLRVCKTPHTAESLAVRIETADASVGYTGDTSPSEALGAFFANVDVLVAECSFLDDARGTSHLVADDVAALATAARARRLVVTHQYFDPVETRLAERIRRAYDGIVTVAHDGLVVATGDVG